MDQLNRNSERIMVFIDNSNIFNGFKKYNIKANYEKLKNIIVNGRILISIFLYEGIVYPISNEKKKWYKDLSNKSGYIIKASFDKKVSNASIEKKVDVKLAIDMISFAYENAYDIAVLVSGDGDFLPVIKKLNKINKKIEVWAFKYSLANTIKEEVDPTNIFYFDDILNEIRI